MLCRCGVPAERTPQGYLHICSVVPPLAVLCRGLCVCVCVSFHLHLNVDGFESYEETEAEIASTLNVVGRIMIWGLWLLTPFIPKPGWKFCQYTCVCFSAKEWFLGEAK